MLLNYQAAMCRKDLRILIDKYGDTENDYETGGGYICLRQIIDLLANGVKNIHIYSMNKPEIAKGIQDNLKGIIL